MIPADEWWMVLQNYSLAIFPTQILFYLLAIYTLVVSLRGSEKFADRVIKGFFSLTFGWISIVLFVLLGQNLPAHNAQAFLFLSLAVLFSLNLFTNTFQLNLPKAGWRRTATLIGIGLVLIGYPIAGLLLGRPVARWIIPGSYHCPTTALALVFMTTALPVKRRWLYFITLALLLIWAIPFPIMIQIPKFGVYEDGIMLVAGIFSLMMLVTNWMNEREIRSQIM